MSHSELKIVQLYIGNKKVKPPQCSVDGCANRAKFLAENEYHEGFDLCFQHAEADAKEGIISNTYAIDNYEVLAKRKITWFEYWPVKGVARAAD